MLDNCAVAPVKPFLKWAGGKSSLLQEILPIVPELNQTATYWEPFVGSASLFLSLQPHKAVLSDLNARLIHCYMTVRDDPDKVYECLQAHRRKHSKDHYYSVRERLNSTHEGDCAQSARFIYLNKTCFNGLYRENRKGEFNVPFGNKINPALPSREHLKRVSELLKNAKLVPSTFEVVLEDVTNGDFVYCDPPYTVMHENNGFIKYNARLFSWSDQLKLKSLVDRLTARGAKVLVSNAAHSSIKELYNDFDIVQLTRASCISADKDKRFKVNEYLIKNY